MATSNYQNHFLQRGKFNPSTAPHVKKTTVNPSAVLGLTALKMVPTIAPYAKKLYDAYSNGKSMDYLESVTSAKYINPTTGEIVDPSKITDPFGAATLVKVPVGYKPVGTDLYNNTEAGKFGSDAERWLIENRQLNPDIAYGDTAGIANVPGLDPVVDPNIENVSNYQYVAPETINAGLPSTTDWVQPAYDGTQVSYPEITDTASMFTDNYDSTFNVGSDFANGNGPSWDVFNSGLNTPAGFDPSTYYAGMPDSTALTDGSFADSIGGWSGDWSAGGIDPSQAATFDAGLGEWVGAGAGTDGIGGGWADGFGGGATAGLMSVGSDLISGKDINVGKAAGSAAGAYGGAALGTAVFPGVGTVVGGALGSMFGGAIGGGGGGSIICGEWVKQGTFDKKTYNKLWKFVTKYYSTTMIRGYHVWATPIVNRMQSGSKLANWFTKKVFGAYVEEMLHVAGITEKGNLFGKVLKVVCEPITWVIGRFSKHDPVNSRWDRKESNKLQEAK